MTENIIFQNHIVDENVVLMRPGKEKNQFFIVHVIFRDTVGKLYIVVKELSDYVYYNEHFQAYVVEKGYEFDSKCWKCLGLQDLKESSISHLTHSQKHFVRAKTLDLNKNLYLLKN